MSKAEELLATLPEGSEEIVVGNHIIIGTDRYIVVPESLKKLGVQYDHNVETITFDCPRYWDENDLSKMNIYVSYMRPDGMLGSHLCDNVVIDTEDAEIMHFDWTISGHTTYAAGNISFLICIKKVGYDGIEVAHWNSEICTDCYVSAGMKCQDTILRRYPDIITQLLLRMDNSEAIVTDAKKAQVAAEEAELGAENARNAIENITVTSEELTSGTPADVEKTMKNGVANFHFKLPAGAKGDTGNGIASIVRTSGDGTPGSIDIYTITMTDGSTATFEVRNGENGLGAEDAMHTYDYDPTGKNTDIFQYADEAANNVAVNAGNRLNEHANNNTHITETERTTWNAKENKPKEISGSGAISRTLEDNTIYTFTNVSSLSLTVPNVQCHIFLSVATNVTAAFIASGGLTLHFSEGGFPALEANCNYEISVWKGNILCTRMV